MEGVRKGKGKNRDGGTLAAFSVKTWKYCKLIISRKLNTKILFTFTHIMFLFFSSDRPYLSVKLIYFEQSIL